jgi:hypothetical protein
MSLRYDQAFVPVRSTEPALIMTLSTLSSAVILQLAATNRIWDGPFGRSVRVMESSGVEFFMQFGTSLAVAVSSGSMRMLGGVAEVFRVDPIQTYVAIFTPSTQISDVNFVLGYGR